MRDTKSSANTFSQFIGRQFSGRIQHFPFAMHPHGLDWIEPGTFLGQQANKNANTVALLPGLLVMSRNPFLGHFTDVPGSMIPKHNQHFLANRLKLFTDPIHKLDRQIAIWVAFNKAQPCFLLDLIRCRRPSDEQTITGQRFGVRVCFIMGFLLQPKWMPRFFPSMQIGLCKATPPGFILKTPDPIRMPNQGFDQPVPTLFLRSYSGSGLVIQCFARDHLTPIRFNVARMVSPVTRSATRSFSKLTSAANSVVQRLVSLPKLRGLWCSISFSLVAVCGVNAAWVLCGRREPIFSTSRPLALKPLITLRAVSFPQPTLRAIVGGDSPRSLANSIWQRLTIKLSRDRNPVWSCFRSSFVISLTYVIRGIADVIPHYRLSCLDLH